jgi:DNA-binding MarR family transcriptional regulator
MGRSTRAEEPTFRREDNRRWSLLTPHAEVLLCIARNPDTRVREIAADVGISERGAHQIVSDLVGAGYVRRDRVGRRNRYAIEVKTALKHATVRHRRVASIVALLQPEPSRTERAPKDEHVPKNLRTTKHQRETKTGRATQASLRASPTVVAKSSKGRAA